MKVKICGITTEEEAEHAAEADYMGLVFHVKSRRNISLHQAIKLCKIIGDKAVGIFVEQTTEEIHSICQETRLTTIQLHGAAKQAFNLPYTVFYACSVDETAPPEVIPLFEESAGRGKAFDWKNFSPPKTPWFLAGGLTPHNVVEAIRLLKPYGVDVSTGVEINGRKDPQLVKTFIQAIREAV